MTEEQPKQAKVEPTEGQIKNYFRRLGMRFRREFKILQQEEFRAFGVEPKEKGWFMGYRGILGAAFALKIGELANLSAEEKRLLAETALLNAAMRRVQIEETGMTATSEERTAVDEKGETLLRKYGVDERVIEIRKAHYAGAKFWTDAVNGETVPKTEEEKMIFKLQKYSAYLHNCMYQKISTSDSGKKIQKTDIADWRERLDDAEKRKKAGTALDTVTLRGRKISNFDMQRMMTDEVEHELTEEIKKTNLTLLKKDDPLWKFFRDAIRSDIMHGILPEVPKA